MKKNSYQYFELGGEKFRLKESWWNHSGYTVSFWAHYRWNRCRLEHEEKVLKALGLIPAQQEEKRK